MLINDEYGERPRIMLTYPDGEYREMIGFQNMRQPGLHERPIRADLFYTPKDSSSWFAVRVGMARNCQDEMYDRTGKDSGDKAKS